MYFSVVLHTDDGRHFGVTVPDLPGCFSGGDTVEDALASAKEAIDLHLEGLAEEGMGWPERQPIDDHRKNPDFAGGLWALVEVKTRFEDRSEKINITLPSRLLAQIDRYTKARGETRSGFLAEAARRAMR